MSLKLHSAVVSAALLASAALSALAQQTGAARPNGSPASAAAPASATAAGYRSAFEGYRAYNEQPVQSWRESNDVVGRIGGWQSYAREGQGGPVAGSGEGPTPAKSEMPGMPAGHGGMNMQPSGGAPAKAMAPAAGNASPAKAPMKMPVQGMKPAPPSGRSKPTTPSAAASGPASGDHTGHPKP